MTDELAEVGLAVAVCPRRSVTARWEIMSHLDRRIQRCSELNDILLAAVEELGANLGLDRCLLLLLDNHAGVGSPACQHTAPEFAPVTGSIRLSEFQPLTHVLFGTGELVIRSRGFENRFTRASDAFMSQIGTRSLVCFSVEIDGDPRALLAMGMVREARDWDEEEVALGRAVADRLAVAMKQAELIRQLRESAREAEALYRASSLLIDTSDIDRLYEQILDAVADELGHPNSSIWLVADLTGDIVLKHGRGERPPETMLRLPVAGPGLMAFAVRTGSIVNSPDVSLDARYVQGPPGTCAELIVPLKVGGKVIGVFNLESNTIGAFTERDERIVSSFAERAARAVEQARLYNQTLEAAAREALVSRIVRSLNQSIDAQSMFQQLVDELGRHLRVNRCILVQVDSRRDKIEVTHQYVSGCERLPEGFDFARFGPPKQQIAKGPVVSNDVLSDPALASARAGFQEHGTRGLMAVRVSDREALNVTITCSTQEPREWRTEELELAQVLAAQAAIALERATLFNEVRTSQLECKNAEAEAEKQTEFLSRLLEIAHDAVFVLDGESRISWSNSRLSELSGYRPEELKQMRLHDLITTIATLGDGTAAADRARPESFKAQLTCKDGGKRYVLATSTPIYETGRLSGILGILHDITDVHVATEKAAQAEKLRALGQLAGGVAHNFNNLLAAILGHTQLLKRALASDPATARLEIIERAATDGAAIVRRINSFSLQQIDEGWEPVDLNQLVRDSLEITRTRWEDDARALGITYTVDFRPTALAQVGGRASELREVFVNIILNALDAMEPNGGRLLINTGSSPGGAFARFSDEGLGMGEEIRQRIFEPFFTTKGVSGTGLGLSASYAIIERHGGRLEVESEPGQGASFTAWFPLIKQAAPSGSTSSTRPLDAIEMLVVDDDDAVREALAGMLEAQGHTITRAASGHEALDKIRRRPGVYRVIFADLAMPEMAGLALAREARALGPDTRIILVTGYGEKALMTDEERTLIESIIAKPFSEEAISAAVERCVAAR